jgi:small subunit ribosomal protein S9
VRITEAKSASMLVNGKTAEEYFPLAQMVKTVFSPMQILGASYAVSAKVRGGWHKAQTEAVRHGLSRAITELVPEQRKDLKVRGFLKRDPRAKERKKFGLKAARRAPQWSKR